MTITRSDINAYKAWAARAWVDGRQVTLTELPTRTLSALRGRSTCALEVRDLPAAAGRPAAVDLVLGGAKAVRFFTGKTAERSAGAARLDRAANLVDLLDLDKALPSTITWSSRSFPNAVRDLLTAGGITAAEIDSIFDPGVAYTLGTEYSIVLRAGKENIGALLRELMEYGGTSAYVTPSGRVRVVDSPGVPSPSSATIYADGANLASEFGIFDAGVSIEGDETAISVFTATGPKRPDGQIPDGTFTASGIVGKPDGRQYRFLQTDSLAQTIARRELGRRARARTSLWISAPLNPSVLPGDTIMVRCARIGYPANTPAYVMEAATTADAGMRLVVSIGPSLVDGWGSSTPPPVADFSMLVEHQLVTVAGVPVASYLVQCRDESRDPAGGTITSRSWAASGTGASPTSSSAEAPIFLFTDLAGASIELTVTSSTGESATVSKGVQANEVQVLARQVSVACGSSGWRVLALTSGWRSWNGAGGSCTAVPSFNESGPLLSGWSNGKIYQAPDALATAPVLLTTLSGSIGALYVNEGNDKDILAGHGSSLSRSTDGGLTWAAVATFPGAVVDIQSSPSNPNEIRVCAGGSEYLSFDGSGFSAVVTGSGSAVALASAPWGHAVAFSGGAVLFEEGYTVNWVGVGGQPSSLSSITPLLDEAAFVCGTTNDLVRDGALSALVFTAGSGSLYKLTWDGAQFVASAGPAASGSGAGKLITGAAHYPIDSTGAQSIGYGALSSVIPPTSIVSNTTDAKGLNLDSGTPSSPPAGWEMVAFDDSSWSGALTRSGLSVPGATGIGASPNTGLVQSHLIRQAFTVPLGTVSTLRWRIQAEDGCSAVYLNGVSLGTVAAGGSAGASALVDLTLDPALILTGATNIIAVKVDDRTDGNYVAGPGVAFRLDINVPV